MAPEYRLEEALWSAFPALKAHKIKVYRSVNAGFDFSASHKSNIPECYAIVPTSLGVQLDHVNWGFRFSPLYGIDYR
jgi:hypothetical protein